MKYRVVIDSTVYLSDKEKFDNKLKTASLNVIDGSESYKELKIDNDFVFSRLDKGHKLTTSQPAPTEFLDIYEDLLKEGAEKIFVVCLAPPLSGTFQSAQLAKNMLDNPGNVHIFESKMAAFGNEMLVLELIDMIKHDKTEEEIIGRITDLNESSNLIFTVENMQNLSRSGRLSKAKALIGSVLRVKPLIQMIDGRLDLFKVDRTHKKVIHSIINRMKETTKDAKTIHIRVLSKNSLETAKLLQDEILKTFKNIKITFNEYLGPVFSLHLGSTGYGVSWCTE